MGKENKVDPSPSKIGNLTMRDQVEEIAALSPLKDTLNELRKNQFAVAGAGIILFFILIGLFAPLFTSIGYADQELVNRLQPPSAENWLGTDDVGRDIFTRIAYGARLSLQVGFFAVTGALFFGTILGIIAGYYGRWIDMLISRIFDILLAFPSILLAIAIVAILGASLQNALIAIAIINIPIFGRLVRSKVISLREEERSEEHTSELQSRGHLVCRLLLEKKNSIITFFQFRN